MEIIEISLITFGAFCFGLAGFIPFLRAHRITTCAKTSAPKIIARLGDTAVRNPIILYPRIRTAANDLKRTARMTYIQATSSSQKLLAALEHSAASQPIIRRNLGNI